MVLVRFLAGRRRLAGVGCSGGLACDRRTNNPSKGQLGTA
jgi:hypothetical protein